jgi:hypothetical protein
MTTLAQSYQAIHDWLVYAVQGGGLYPFDPTRVRWGTQDFPRAVTPLVTLEVVGDTKMSGTPEHTRNDQTGAWATYTRTTHETTVRVEAWTRYSDTSPQLDNRAVGLIYWRSSALGRWARRDGFATVLAYKDEIRASMTRCLELDREYFFGGPDRYFGAFFAVAPSYAGGDLERSRQHFDYSISRFPGYFGTHVLYAVEYAVKTQDRALFTRELQWVIDNDPNMLPDVAPENVVEQRKAREALARADELFE